MSDGTASESAQTPSLVGTILDGRYRLTKKLGEGGMGEVYAGEHVHIEKRFAIKLLRPEIVSNQEAVKRFYQEARSASSIGHRNIIGIEDFGQLPDGRVYMCMELLKGAPLNDMIAPPGTEGSQQPMPIDRLLNIMIQTMHGLAAAHAKGIVHRDMKPENIYVTEGPNGEDIPKLLDFGIAKVSGNDGQNNLTRTGTIFGTPFYMAPEQALGNPVDARTDIYAVGIIMYEVFAGSLPFQGESFMGILTQHITTEPEPVWERAGKAGRQLPPELADIITRCLRKNPAERHQSMDELIAALVPIYRGMAGAGMSSYMEAFPVVRSGQQAVVGPSPTGAMPRPGQMPMSGGVAPTMMSGMPPPGMMQTPAGGMPPVGGYMPGPSQSTPAFGASSSGLYNPNSSVIEAPKSGGGKGLVIALILLLVVGGGAAGVYFAMFRDPGKPGPGSAGSSDVALLGSDGSAKAGDPGSAHTKVDDVKDPVKEPVKDPAKDPVSGTVKDPHDSWAGSDEPTSFEIWENGKKIGMGPTNLEVAANAKRTLTIKAKGYKDRQVLLDGKNDELKFSLDHVPGVVTNGSNGSNGTVTRPPRTKLDCSKVIVDSTNAACRKQYCANHTSDNRCNVDDD
ncbi:MAG: protein kinase [Proteobacteria bacterium]|nr:protein kinase [Pseudomonadota bacterium]